MRLMLPSATVAGCGQVGKLLFGFPLQFYGCQKAPTMAAAGALLGVTISECGSLVYIYAVYRFKYKALKAQNRCCPRKIHVMRKREMLNSCLEFPFP